jgi:FAD/FMN-containing dehydrogenase
MRAVKRAVDPENLSNPDKLIPPPDTRSSWRPREHASRLKPSGGLDVNRTDAFVEIDDICMSFADVENALADTPYELPYEPLGGTPDMSVLAALDLGLPSLREPTPARPRDLILGAHLRRHSEESPLELGGRCAKDVAGYELRKLVYGAHGRLGALCGVRLRIMPRPTDSRLLHSTTMALDAAIALCRRLRLAGLPFRYLGVLISADGGAAVTGRLELNGGALDRYIETICAISMSSSWHDSADSRWCDPVMRSLADATRPLVGAPYAMAPVADLPDHGRPVFVSVGHRRVWWRGVTADPDAGNGWLVKDLVDAFAAVPR